MRLKMLIRIKPVKMSVFYAVLLAVLLLGGSALAELCSIGETGYPTLQAAIDSVAENGSAVIKLHKAIALTGQLEIKDSRTITLEGGAITRGKLANGTWYTGTVATVAAGSTLKLDGGLTVDGGNDWTFLEKEYMADMKALQRPADRSFYATSQEGAPDLTAVVFNVSGRLELAQMTLKDHYSTNGAFNLFALKNGGELICGTEKGNTLITHNAKKPEGRVLGTVAAGCTLTINAGTIISHNYCDTANGTLASGDGEMVFNGGEVTKNYGYNANGLFMATGSGRILITGGRIHDNYSWMDADGNHPWGGVIYMHGSSSVLDMQGGVIENNHNCCVTGIATRTQTSTINLTKGVLGAPNGTLDRPGNLFFCKVTIGKDFVINGGKSWFAHHLINDGTINGTVHMTGRSQSPDPQVISGSGTQRVNDPSELGLSICVNINVVVEGGTFLGDIKVRDGSTLLIKAGTYDKYDQALERLDKGLGLGDNKNGTWTVGPAFPIECELENGTALNLPVQYVSGYEYMLPNPTREGYTFLGWTGSNGTTPQKNLRVLFPGRGAVNYVANWRLGVESDEPQSAPPPQTGDSAMPLAWLALALASAAMLVNMKRKETD